jgi:hypothetical protein
MNLSNAKLVAAIALCASACGGDDGNSTVTPAEATYANNAALASSSDAAFMYSMSDPFFSPYYAFDVAGATTTATSDASNAASTVAAGLNMYFTPKDCVDMNLDQTRLTLTLSNCTAPLGIESVNGTVHADFSMNGHDIDIALSSKDLTVNDDVVVLDANGVYSMTGTKSKKITTMAMGSIAHGGQTLSRKVAGSVTWTAGSKCATVESNGTITANGKDSAIQSKFQRCAGECPKSGNVKLTGATTTTLKFDGTPNPMFETSDGKSGTVALRCGA